MSVSHDTRSAPHGRRAIAAVGAPAGKGNPAFGVYMKTKYDLPAGTTIEWFFVKNSGQCIQYQPTQFTQTAGNDSTSICASAAGDPAHHVETGILHFYFKAGSANGGPHHAEARCENFSSITCIGGSETVPASVHEEIELDVTLGPIS